MDIAREVEYNNRKRRLIPMIVEYIGHSGVLVELDKINLLFDVIAPVSGGHPAELRHDWGTFPKLDPAKDTVVFASHNHGDHYSEEIWKLRGLLPHLHYVISKDVHFSSGVRARLGITDEDMSRITFVKNYTSQDIRLPGGESIHIQTIPSTDEGVAFLVKAGGKIIYHAGDHHMWMWELNGETYMQDMEEVFRRTVSRLEIESGEVIDIAFLLLDQRLAPHTYDGMDTYLELLPVRHVVPIHQWKNYDLTDAYIADRSDMLASKGVTIHKVTGENCKFYI